MSVSEFVSNLSTPTYLFLLLNLIIITIYITTRLAKPPPHPPCQAAPLGRAPSSLIDRVRFIDRSFYKFESHAEPDPVRYHNHPRQDSAVMDGLPLARAPSLLGRLRSINFNQKKFEHRDPEPEQLHPAEAVHNSAVNRKQSPLSLAPLLLDRLKSINIYHQKSNLQTDIEPVNTLNRAPSFLKCVKSIKFPSFYNPGEANLDTESDHEDVNGPTEDHAHGLVRRSESERMGQEGPKPRMRKMASDKSAAAAEDNVEVEEIDAKAEDFIQRFRKHLRLQRLDSLMRYKELLTAAAAR